MILIFHEPPLASGKRLRYIDRVYDVARSTPEKYQKIRVFPLDEKSV